MRVGEKIQKIADFIQDSNIDIKQKKYALNLILDLSEYVNIINNKMANYMASASGMNRTKFDDYYWKLHDIALITKAFFYLEDYTEEVSEFLHQNFTEINPITVEKCITISRSYQLYKTINNDIPRDIQELREFMKNLKDGKNTD
jgi:hypothetical protein